MRSSIPKSFAGTLSRLNIWQTVFNQGRPSSQMTESYKGHLYIQNLYFKIFLLSHFLRTLTALFVWLFCLFVAWAKYLFRGPICREPQTRKIKKIEKPKQIIMMDYQWLAVLGPDFFLKKLWASSLGPACLEYSGWMTLHGTIWERSIYGCMCALDGLKNFSKGPTLNKQGDPKSTMTHL